MVAFKFSKNKYGVGLLMDIGTYADIPAYFFEETLHETDFYEIVFFKQGNGYILLDQRRIPVENDMIVFISPFQKRQWFVDKANIDCYFLLFQADFLSSFFVDKLFTYRLRYFYNKATPLYLKPDANSFFRVQSVLEDLLTEIKNIRKDSEHVIRALLYFLLVKLNREYEHSFYLSPDREQHIIALKFKELLIREVTNRSGIDYYAGKLGVSRVTLNKSVKAHFGIPVSEMINEFLMFEIKSQLLYTDRTIKEIAYDLHFSAPNHMTRLFKTLTGLSPKDFRLTYQNGRNIH